MNFSKKFKESENQLINYRIRFVSIYLAVPLVLGFIIVDYVYYPNLLLEFFLLRILVIPSVLLTLLANKFAETKKKFSMLAVHVMVMFLAFYNAKLVAMTGYEYSLYWGGLVMVTIGTLAFIPMPMIHVPIILTIKYVPYYAIIFFNREDIDYRILFVNSALIFGCVTVALATYLISLKNRLLEFKAQEEIKELANQQNKTVARMVHDVKIPISAFSAFISLVENTTSIPELHKNISKLKGSLHRIIESSNQMISDIMELGSDSKVSLSPLSIQNVIGEAIWECFVLSKKIYHFKYNFNHRHLIEGDYIKIKRIFQNLLSNIIQATVDSKNTPIITFSTITEDEVIWIEIANTESLSDSKNPNQLIKPYASENKTILNKGLGLSIISHFVKLHQGEIKIESDRQRNTFIVKFSIKKSELLEQQDIQNHLVSSTQEIFTSEFS